MLIIERDYTHYGEKYVVKAKESGFGRGWKVDNLTLEEAKMAIPHYFGTGHGAISVSGCGLCAHFHRRRARDTLK